MAAELAVVTGAGGHVGTNLVRALLAEGQAVRMVDICKPVTAVRLGATWVPADVRDAARMRDACAGADVVYHLAAVISVVGGMGGLVESVNVDGVRAVAQAALAAFPTVSYAKAIRELGHRPRPIEETIADLYAYFRRTGLLPAQPPPAQHGT